MEDKNIDELQQQLTNLAVQIAEGFRVKLDFSNDSIKSVEKILGDIHEDYKKSGAQKDLDGIALEFAAYIVTTIEHNFEKGRWERDQPEFGKNTFPYFWKDKTLFPYSWCQKRIYDGEGDNVWDKYQQFVLT